MIIGGRWGCVFVFKTVAVILLGFVVHVYWSRRVLGTQASAYRQGVCVFEDIWSSVGLCDGGTGDCGQVECVLGWKENSRACW